MYIKLHGVGDENRESLGAVVTISNKPPVTDSGYRTLLLAPSCTAWTFLCFSDKTQETSDIRKHQSHTEPSNKKQHSPKQTRGSKEN